MDIDKIYWHKAILPALQLELEAYLNLLSFEAEHPLSTDSLFIDVVVIKKKPEAVIDNPIARFFRTINIFEYKSPTVSLSLNDFYRAIAYLFLYGSMHQVDITDMTLSILLTKKPEEVLGYLHHTLKYEIEERESGIYTVTGFPFPLQLIENKKLSPAEHRFLRLLNDNLDEESISFLMDEAKKDRNLDIKAFVQVIFQANSDRLKEKLRMKNESLEQVLVEAGLAATWEARGEERGEARGKELGKKIKAKEIAQNMIKMGLTGEQIVEATQLDFSMVESLMGAAHA